MRWPTLAVMLLAVVFSVPADVRADADEEARMLFEAGRSAFDAGRYIRALSHFEAAHELSGKPLLLFNMALAHDQLGHRDQALTLLKRYLEEDPDSPHLERVRARIEQLEADRDPVSPRSAALLSHGGSAPSDAPPLYRRWYVWAATGAAVVAIVVVASVMAGSDGSGADPVAAGGTTRVPGQPVPGSDGSVIYALEAGP